MKAKTAESRQIIWNIQYKINEDVTTKAKLSLIEEELKHGKWIDPPPATVQATTPHPQEDGYVGFIRFKSSGKQNSLHGTEGKVVYRGDDPGQTEFTIAWNVPYNGAKSGGITGGSTYFDVEDVKVVGEKKVMGTGTIIQVKPTI